MFIAVVSSAEYRNQLSIRKLLYAIHDTLMRTDNLFHVVLLAETLHTVRTELDDVPSLVGVTHVVGLNAHVLVSVSRVTPEDIHHQEVFLALHFMHDFQGTFQFVQISHFIQCSPNAPVQTEDAIVNECSHWQIVEDIVDGVEH